MENAQVLVELRALKERVDLLDSKIKKLEMELKKSRDPNSTANLGL